MDGIFGGVYRGKKVLVTGHTGFKGSWLSLWLEQMGARVIGYSLAPPTQPSLFEILKIEGRIAHSIGDVRNEKMLRGVFAKYKPDIVFHMAAQSLVRLSYADPRLTYETNIMGTVNVLEAVRRTKSVKSALNVTSDKCYENKEWPFGYREIDPLGGYDPYSSSKGCSELVTAAYRNSFFNPEGGRESRRVAIASARAGNVIGGGDWASDRLIPDCVRALAENRVVIVRNPDSVRPWQHVLEPLSGYLWLGARMLRDGGSFSEAWNFGPAGEDVARVEDTVREVTRLWGGGRYRVRRDAERHEAKLLKLDTSKARLRLNWRSVYSIGEALGKTIDWYRRYYKEKDTDMHGFTRGQIGEYVECARQNGLEWAR